MCSSDLAAAALDSDKRTSLEAAQLKNTVSFIMNGDVQLGDYTHLQRYDTGQSW